MATYYIDSDSGNDNNDGSIGDPWETIAKANAELTAGDTVYIRDGIYNNTIRPSVSGTVSNPITYAAYNNEEAIITGVGDGVNVSERSYIVVDGLSLLDVGNHWVEFAPNGTYNTIKNCYMEEAGNYTGIALSRGDGTGANYNKILNNTLVSVCNPKSVIGVWSSGRNLIEGNSFRGGPHDALIMHDRVDGSCDYNIIRNNYFQNKWHHNVAINETDYILIENNIIVDAGDDAANNVCGTEEDRTMARQEHKGLMANTRYGIFRGNILVNNGYGIALSSNSATACDDNRFYNNTIYKNYEGLRVDAKDALAPIKNIIKNNIIYDSVNYAIREYGGDGPLDNDYINNDILGGVIHYGSSDTNTGTLAVDPLFVDRTNRDFNLRPGSPMINAGEWLTTANGAGSGKVISVDDARYFMDGWGIIEGDLIQFEGQSVITRITSIDHNTDTITVEDDMTWTDGLGVCLPYDGTAPDIGASYYVPDQSADLAPIGQATSNPSPVLYEATTAHVLGTATPANGRSIATVELTSGSGSVTGTTSWVVTCNLAVGVNSFIVRITDDESDYVDVYFSVTRNTQAVPPATTSKMVGAFIKGGKLY